MVEAEKDLNEHFFDRHIEKEESSGEGHCFFIFQSTLWTASLISLVKLQRQTAKMQRKHIPLELPKQIK